jgi:uncharacterized repeat protein (TIGR03803 family)
MKKLLLFISAIALTTATSFAQYTDLFNFTDHANGSLPWGDLISDGTFLYGMTSWGGTGGPNCGTDGCGVVFKIKPDGTGYDTLLNFTSTNGSLPLGSLVSDGTFFYGMTNQGGIDGWGSIFKIKPNGTGYYKLYDFIGGGNNDGQNPRGSLVFDSAKTFLYGMAAGGSGNYNQGEIFKIKPDGTGYANLFDFPNDSSTASDGSLISHGNFLYGMGGGGTHGFGTVFKIKPDGSGYSILLNFDSIKGSLPLGSLLFEGNFLYGMTQGGGTNDMGVIFKVKPDGTGYLKLLDFTGTANGKIPGGSLISDGTFLYGMTQGGGTNDMGVVFKIKLDGTGYVKLFNFTGANGSNPHGSLISDGTFLYGMTDIGGTNSGGVIFKYALATGIAENNAAINFNVYPNPSNGAFTVSTKENDYKLTITNVIGEIVYQAEIKNQKSEIDLGKQPNGVYFLNIKTEKGSCVKKLIINW